MLTILYEDNEILVVEKPAGMESQSSRRLEPDMVSEIKKYLSRSNSGQLSTNSFINSSINPSINPSIKPSTNLSTGTGEIYVGVIHRLDKPVGGVMVYAKTREAAASLSRQVQDGRMKKVYRAAVCGKPVDNVGNYVDYLLRDGKTNCSRIVDKGEKEARRAELLYRVLESVRGEKEEESLLSLVEVELLTGRHHQIRVQFAAHGSPLWGDAKYNPLWGGTLPFMEADKNRRGMQNRKDQGTSAVRRAGSLALAAVHLSFLHPVTGERMAFSMEPKHAVFKKFKG